MGTNNITSHSTVIALSIAIWCCAIMYIIEYLGDGISDKINVGPPPLKLVGSLLVTPLFDKIKILKFEISA